MPAHRQAADDTKTGVFIYCQEHAREWATPLVCLETAERLLRNYGTDPETTNAGRQPRHLHRPDDQRRRRRVLDVRLHEPAPEHGQLLRSSPPGNNDPTSRNSWGVDLNRNFSVGSLFDGYDGGGASCTGDTFSGPAEFSEPETRNEQYIQSTYPNIKFAMNIHSSGGYFMWPPGAYKPAGRVTLPYAVARHATSTSSSPLTTSSTGSRATAARRILPARTGPVADVLYSAAGNSADEAYYNHGIIGYDFEIGADRFRPTLSVAHRGATGVRAPRTVFQAGDKVTIDPGTTRSPRSSLVQPASGTVHTALTGAAAGSPARTAEHRNFQPTTRPGYGQFANGNYALGHSRERQDGPGRHARRPGHLGDAVRRHVQPERGGRHPLHDRRLDADRQLAGLPAGAPARPAGPDPHRRHDDPALDAKDFKGNVSTGSKTFYIGTQAPGGAGGSVAGDARADAGHAGLVRRVRARRGEGLHREHHADRDLDRR